MAWTRQTLQQQQSKGKGKVAARKRVTEKNTSEASTKSYFLAGNTWIYCHLPYQKIMTVPCMGLAHTKTATGV